MTENQGLEQKTSNDSKLRKIFIIFFALFGFVTSIKLANIYFESNFDPYALPSFCSINEFIDCDGVAQTTFSQFLGIPLAYWGIFFYVFVMFMCFTDKLKNVRFLKFLEVFKNPLAYISILGLFSFLIAVTLASISIFQIKKLCILCFFTYFLDLFIAISATDFKVGFWNNLKTCFKDFFDAVKIKKYLVSFIVVVLVIGGFLAYTATSYVFTPQVKRYNSFKEFDVKKNPYNVKGNVLGDENAKVIIDIYSDYRCPICYTYNVMIYRAARDLSNIKFVHHNLPLDTACNKNLQQAFHEGSCMLARYAYAAEKQGNLWEFNSEVFDNQPKDEYSVLKLAKSLGFDTIQLRKDANSPQANEEIQKDIKVATDLGIDGTPATIINGLKPFVGIKPYYELLEILKKAGASDRK